MKPLRVIAVKFVPVPEKLAPEYRRVWELLLEDSPPAGAAPHDAQSASADASRSVPPGLNRRTG
jgi:hypothetical protein